MPKPCGVPLSLNRYREPDLDGPLCAYLRTKGHTRCIWHWLLRQPIGVQVTRARERRGDRARPPRIEWPHQERWCSGCQSFVPLFYTSGSRCRACQSSASHEGHVRRTYQLEPGEYDRLLEWQGGVCYICGQTPRSQRLAVDHDHRTNEVRGLLCANDEWGCNVQLRRLLNDVEVARRALEYVEVPPLQRMREGEEPREPYRPARGILGLMQQQTPGWQDF